MQNKPAPVPPEGQLLIFQDGSLRVQVRIDGTTVWLPQRLMAELYQVTVANINQHLKAIYEDGELSPEATIKQILIVQTEATRQVSRMALPEPEKPGRKKRDKKKMMEKLKKNQKQSDIVGDRGITMPFDKAIGAILKELGYGL